MVKMDKKAVRKMIDKNDKREEKKDKKQDKKMMGNGLIKDKMKKADTKY